MEITMIYVNVHVCLHWDDLLILLLLWGGGGGGGQSKGKRSIVACLEIYQGLLLCHHICPCHNNYIY